MPTIGGMDGSGLYSLVPVPQAAEQRALVPVSSSLVVDSDWYDDAEPDRFALLWQGFCKLAWFYLCALAFIRCLLLQLVELRQQAGYWRALHERAVRREAKLAADIPRLPGELREVKRPGYGRRVATAPTTPPPNPSAV